MMADCMVMLDSYFSGGLPVLCWPRRQPSEEIDGALCYLVEKRPTLSSRGHVSTDGRANLAAIGGATSNVEHPRLVAWPTVAIVAFGDTSIRAASVSETKRIFLESP